MENIITSTKDYPFDDIKLKFDYESFARDLKYDYMVCDVSDYNVAIFNNC